MGGSGLGLCRWRFSSSVRPWKGAAGTSCRPGGSCAGGFARGGAPVPRGLRGDVLDARPAEWRPASVPGSPRAKLGQRGGRRAGLFWAPVSIGGPAGRRRVRWPCPKSAVLAKQSRSSGRKGCQAG